MDASFARAIGDWAAFYTYLGAASATLLGLLFVAVSLRLNIFRQADVADVRDYAAQTFGQFFALVLIAALVLMPDPRPPSVGIPVALLGGLGVLWLAYLVRQSRRVNTPRDPYAPLRTTMAAVTLVVDAGLLLVGLAIALDHTGALRWLAILCLVMLTLAVLGAWVLLAHARPS